MEFFITLQAVHFPVISTFFPHHVARKPNLLASVTQNTYRWLILPTFLNHSRLFSFLGGHQSNQVILVFNTPRVFGLCYDTFGKIFEIGPAHRTSLYVNETL